VGRPLFSQEAIKKDHMTLLEAALKSPRCIVSVMGDHAGEGAEVIFDRKTADIARTGVTFWLIRSPKARPHQVQKLCNPLPAYAIFVEPATRGGARSTTKNDAAREYSRDGGLWHLFPEEMSPVTGKLDNAATALVFDMIITDVCGILDLWNYSEAFEPDKPLRFILGCSTVCAIKKDMKSNPEKMKSRYREIVAVARFANPYCVWIR
jgi:hypothetical protein